MGIFGLSKEEKEEIEKMKNYINYNSSKLDPVYKQQWDKWMVLRNTVAARLKLSEQKLLFITMKKLVDHILLELSNSVGMDKYTPESFAKTKGTTKLAKIFEPFIKLSDEYEKKAGRDLVRFDAEMQKVVRGR